MNDIRQKKQDRDTVLMLMPFFAVLGKIIQLFFLPDKYFYDSVRMIGMMTKKGPMAGWEGYRTTVNIFEKIDFFHFTKFSQWSIALGIIGTLLLMIIVSRCKSMTKDEAIFTLMATGLLNIYAFNIAKEPVQFVFFLMIFIIIALPINNTIIKLIGCAAVFYWESNTFRPYYIMMACMCFFLFVVFYLFRKVFRRITIIKIIIATILCFGAMFLFVYLSQYIDSEQYYEAINLRDDFGNTNAATSIQSFYKVNGNYIMFMANYIINALRMMIPIELIIKSPVYSPFFVYQIFILKYWFRAIKNIRTINSQTLLSLICFTAYLFGSFVFEPDFGSWVRHEAASFPAFFYMVYSDLSIEESEEPIGAMVNES